MSTPEIVFDAATVPEAPNDPLYSLVAAYEADTCKDKVDLGVGAYRDENGRPWILPVVRKAEKLYFESTQRDHEYLPIAGLPEFNDAVQKLILGPGSPAIKDRRVTTAQAISGTGAVHLGAALLAKFTPSSGPKVYVSSPTWPIHDQVFNNVGLATAKYPYFSHETKSLDFESMLNTLSIAPRGSIIILHACAHNPTGVDPSEEQWKEIAEVMKTRSHFPFFDCAYQGFASGSLTRDNFAVRYFIEQGFTLGIAQSFAKNLGLYGERVGAFHFVTGPGPDAATITRRVTEQLAILTRSVISSPPIYGAKIAAIILNDPVLFSEWEGNLRTMAGRIVEMRACLKAELEGLQTPGTWDHITSQIGMFSFTGLNSVQVKELQEKWHVYMAETGRISVAGLNHGNVKYFARAVDDVVRRIE